jgi:hypothetical protein
MSARLMPCTRAISASRQRLAGAGEQAGPLVLEAGAGAHLGLDLGHRGEHAVDLALADGGALTQDGLQQAAGGDDLGVEVPEHLGAERGDGGDEGHGVLRIVR